MQPSYDDSSDSTDTTDETKTDPYKEMYEMGQKLMDMATENGYDPEADASDSSDTSDNTEGESGADKAKVALGFLKE